MYDRFSAPLFAAATAEPPTSAAVAEPLPAPLTTAAPVDKVGNIFARAVCVQVSLSCLGTRRKMTTDESTLNADQAARELLHVSAEILKSPELDAIRKADRALQTFIRTDRASGPAPFGDGVWLVSLELLAATDADIVAKLEARAVLVDTFCAAYDARRLATMQTLGALADRFTWPSLAVVRNAFDARVRYLAIDTPEALRMMRGGIFEREQRKAAAEWAEAIDECRQVLRGAFADLVGHLAERLTTETGAKPKIFRDSAVTKFDDFVSTFQARNIADDAALGALVQQARDVMKGATAQQLRDNATVRESIAASMAALKTALDPLVAEQPSRRYDSAE